MATDGALSFSVTSVVEDVLQQHGNNNSRSRNLDLVDARKAEEAAKNRYEAAAWIRKIVGIVGAKSLPDEPSEEEFRLGLRSGMILCNVLNKIQPGAVPKVVESPCDPAINSDGAALSAYQYFENIRNFLVAVQELGIPLFEASDLEQGGKSSRIVNCVLGLKSYSDWKKEGGTGVWKFGGNIKSNASVKQIVRKNSEPFTNSLSRCMYEKPTNGARVETEKNKTSSSSLSMLVRAILTDKKPEEVPNLVESVLNKVVEEFEHRVASKIELSKATTDDSIGSCGNKSLVRHTSDSAKNLKQTLLTTKAGMQFMQMKFHEEMHNIGMHINGLAHAASGYHRVLEENRKLYNQVQDLKGSIRVYCRVRPFLPGQSNSASSVDHIDDGTITISIPSKNGRGRKSFNFNKIFGSCATQGEVFSDTQPLIRSVLDGYNVCIFAYGQTGSGKTYTMTGPNNLTEQSQGVNYRALGDLFLLAEQRKDTVHYDVSVQMIEIYNEQVRDLLVSDGVNKRYPSLYFVAYVLTASQGLTVPDASLVRVTSTCDVIDLMNLGQKNRSVSATALNDRSSRSHSCLTVHVQGRDLASGTILRGCMHLVDLAGSERVNKSEVTGDRLKEAQHINKSLSALGDVISALAQKNAHVPYRNSKLTQLLQDSLGGQAKTLMFVHISPEPEAVGETISTLKFAERVSTVELGTARVNKDSTDVKELKEQIATLKADLAKKEESVPMQYKVMSSPCRVQPSPVQSNPQKREMLADSNVQRRPMDDVGNIEISNNSAFRQKRPSFDLDELLGNSPSWPPVNIPCENYVAYDKDMGTGEWVDKVMVNKQEVGKPFGHWESENGMSDAFAQKYLSESSKLCQEKSSNLFSLSDHFDITPADDLEEFDATTSDSSEPDLLCQFNNSKLNSFTNGNESKIPRPNPKHAKSPETRNLVNKVGSSPSRKTNGIGHTPQRNGRHAMPTEIKRKAGNRE
ncbi:hypothetical protein RND71_024615 [Anisodus tanguticus]|uniref:Uncharacterized protein n=1 Tax=Anisodus tanguticus TaxID=243964 RepID=A0AAE1VBV0_9SOLA|nr:hypothetical protein RND71_024615 [Anisodus tanguticus]